MNNHIDIISLGCAKNLVDTEQLIYLLREAGYVCHPEPETPASPIAIVNTCAFIADAKEESINTILQFVGAKEAGRLDKLFVMGCLSQRYKDELKKELPEVDGFFGKYDFPNITDALKALQRPQANIQRPSPAIHPRTLLKRVLTTPAHYAYLKIAEGCNRHCAYCIIPHITGPVQSKRREDILKEVKWLVSKGVKELQVIAQELTAYGTDLNQGEDIARLISDIADIPGVEWIRLHYAYPAHFPYQLLQVIRQRDNVCNYLDVALQHISDNMLKAMRRHLTKEETYQFVERVRKECPDIRLRTTMMVGFPGETDADFQELTDFVKWARFERLGAFAYSEEEGTYSARHFKDNVPQEVKQSRLDQLMRIQQDISEELMSAEVGKKYKVITDRVEGDHYICRNEYSSPDVDPEILIPVNGNTMEAGTFHTVEITGSTPFDLYGKTV